MQRGSVGPEEAKKCLTVLRQKIDKFRETQAGIFSRRYPPEIKEQVIEAYRSGIPPAVISRECDIARSVLQGWPKLEKKTEPRIREFSVTSTREGDQQGEGKITIVLARETRSEFNSISEQSM